MDRRAVVSDTLTRILVHEAGHVVALHRCFGPIVVDVKLTRDGDSDASVHFTNPLSTFDITPSVALAYAATSLAGDVAVHRILGAEHAADRVEGADFDSVLDAYDALREWAEERRSLRVPRFRRFFDLAFVRAHRLIAEAEDEVLEVAEALAETGEVAEAYLHPLQVAERKLKTLRLLAGTPEDTFRTKADAQDAGLFPNELEQLEADVAHVFALSGPHAPGRDFHGVTG